MKSAAKAGASDVEIFMDLPDGAHGAGTTGTFTATGVLCSSGTVVVQQGAILHTLTCADGSGSFNIGFSGPIIDGHMSTWHFVGHGTGDFASVTGGGDVTANTCTQPGPCSVELKGVATIH